VFNMRKLSTLLGGLTAAALAVAVYLPTQANAMFLNGLFTVDIYNFNAGGSASNANAVDTNPNLVNANKIGTYTWNGTLNFSVPSGANVTIQDFFDSNPDGGTLLPNPATPLSSTILSSGAGTPGPGPEFQITTLFDFNWTQAAAVSGGISHDDGISLYDDGVDLNLGVAAPQSEGNTPTPYSLTAGSARLIYAAANGNPEVLEVTAVPIPGAVWLFGSGVLGLLGVGYSRKRKAAA
jgi:hypothetical protein